MLRRRFAIWNVMFLLILRAANAAPPDALPTLTRYASVEIETAKTSIYIGNVTMTMPRFTRKDGAFSSTYSARVFPYFFSSEKGKLSITIPDDDLRRLARGETIEFTGHAENTDGEARRIEGRAVPTNPTSGKIKVRVFVSKKIELIFNTTYRFPEMP